MRNQNYGEKGNRLWFSVLSAGLTLLLLLVTLVSSHISLAAISDDDFVDLCRYGSFEEVSEAIQHGANVNAMKISRIGSALMGAAGSQISAPEKVALLLAQGADLNFRPYEDDPNALYNAISGDSDQKLKVVELLLEAGIDATYLSPGGASFLDDAFFFAFKWTHEENAKLVELLLRVRESPEITFLTTYQAACFGGPLSLDIILKATEDNDWINGRHDSGRTPLMCAARVNLYPESIVVLLKAGADMALKDNEGLTALDHAAQNKRGAADEILAILRNPAAYLDETQNQRFIQRREGEK